MDKVIPYLPMDATSNALVVELKLQQLEKTLSGELYTTQGGCGCCRGVVFGMQGSRGSPHVHVWYVVGQPCDLCYLTAGLRGRRFHRTPCTTFFVTVRPFMGIGIVQDGHSYSCSLRRHFL